MPSPSTHNPAPFGEDWRSFDPGRVDLSPERRAWCVESGLAEYLRGDRAAGDLMKAHLAATSDTETRLIFERLETRIGALVSPFSRTQAEAAAVVASLARNFLTDWGTKLWQHTADIALAADQTDLHRAALIKVARLCFDADNLPRCREACKAVLSLPSERSVSHLEDYLRAYTLMGQTFWVEYNEPRAERCAEAMSSYIADHRGLVRQVLKSSTFEQRGAFQAVLNAHLFIAELMGADGQYEEAREMLKIVGDIILKRHPHELDGCAQLLLASARLSYDEGTRQMDTGRGPEAADVAYSDSIEFLELATRLMDAHKDDWNSDLRRGEVTLWIGKVRYEMGDVTEALGELEDALYLLREQEVFGNSECAAFSDEARRLIDECREDLKASKGADSEEDQEEKDSDESWRPENDPE